MPLLERPVSRADLPAIAALVHNFPDGNLHTVDLPYRLCSWSFDYPENTQLWSTAKGELLAWAVLQVPFWTIDYAFHPDTDLNLHQMILDWADGQAKALLNTPSGHSAWFVPVFYYQTEHIHDLEAIGFASQANVAENPWSQVHMRLAGPLPAEAIALPAGFTIRPLAGEQEVAAYVELHRLAFESKNMTAEWRSRTLQQSRYVADIDLVVVAPDGQLAAFCIGWLDEVNGLTAGQIEPLGVHPGFRHLGLGKAVLVECLRRLHQKGAQDIYVQTDNFRDAAYNLYESVGFRVQHDVLMFRKDYD
jgi:mycothiol synthase